MPINHSFRRLAAGLALATFAAACSSNPDDDVAATAATTTQLPVEQTVPTIAATPGDPTLALDAGDAAPSADAYVPATPPAEAMGRAGYTRYVFAESGGQILPSLVEGPRGSQIRCQAPDLPCSYVDLRELLDSGAPIPPALDMTDDELADLVAELAAGVGALDRFAQVDEACAAGYFPDRTQTANMGSHFTNNDLVVDGKFEPGRPEILLYAAAGGAAPSGPLGQCRGGEWEGTEVEVVGVAYYLPRFFVGDDHVDGFTGDLDNWHIHYNLCRLDGTDVIVAPDQCGAGVPDGPPDQPRGAASEGWMIHAWADPEHDNQLGVFSMWNPSLWPVAAPGEALERGSLSDTSAAAEVIEGFTLPDVQLDGPGSVTFFNADDVAHTVTAGRPTEPGDQFDSGVIAGRDGAQVTITQPGTYNFFCAIHPEMQAEITVAD